LAHTAADVTVLDLEDAVPVEEKSAARVALGPFVSAVVAAAPSLIVLVRVNPIDTQWFSDDVRSAAQAGAAGVVLPKAGGAYDADAVLAEWSAGHGTSDPVLLAGLETAIGVEAPPDIVRAGGLSAVYFRAEDYIADLGGLRTESSTEVLYARSRVAMAAALGRIDTVDQVTVRYHDQEAFRSEARVARELGYRGKLCVHPDQVVLAHEAFNPTAQEVGRARAILDALAAAGGGVATFEGQMIDAPAAVAAKKILAVADVT
jgi:citrate lyase subunit beta / citryl-CoA lyase